MTHPTPQPLTSQKKPCFLGLINVVRKFVIHMESCIEDKFNKCKTLVTYEDKIFLQKKLFNWNNFVQYVLMTP